MGRKAGGKGKRRGKTKGNAASVGEAKWVREEERGKAGQCD